jgi:hypothetical protein
MEDEEGNRANGMTFAEANKRKFFLLTHLSSLQPLLSSASFLESISMC